MFEFLKRWFFRSEKKPDADTTLAVGYARLADIPTNVSMEDKLAIVCSADRMTLFARHSLPQRLCSGEMCWLVPAGDIPLAVEFCLGQTLLAVDMQIRFEADDHFAAFTASRESLTEDELKTLVVGEFLSLIELESLTAVDLLPGDSQAESKLRWNQLRAGLSLLLQRQGLRCTGIENIRSLALVAPHSAAKVPPDVRDEISQTLSAVKTDADWDAFMDEMGDAGAFPHAETAQELGGFGSALLAGQQTADDISDKICEILEQNGLQNCHSRQNVANWKALTTRLRWVDSLTLEPEADPEIPPSEEMAKLLPKKLRRPGIWYILRRASADEKLQRFLVDSITRMQGMLSAGQTRLPRFSQKALMEKNIMMLGNIKKQLAMMPDIHAPTWRMRGQQRHTAELLAVLKRCVTGTQMIFALIRELTAGEMKNDMFEAHAAELERLLTILGADVRNRRDIYAVNV